jgi:hypothetical protein
MTRPRHRIANDRIVSQAFYRDEAKADALTGGIVTFDTGIFASGDDLRQLVQQVMNQAIDQSLDKPAFAAVLRG